MNKRIKNLTFSENLSMRIMAYDIAQKRRPLWLTALWHNHLNFICFKHKLLYTYSNLFIFPHLQIHQPYHLIANEEDGLVIDWPITIWNTRFLFRPVSVLLYHDCFEVRWLNCGLIQKLDYTHEPTKPIVHTVE